MGEDLSLTTLSRKLKQSRHTELEQIKQIEEERLRDLMDSLRESYRSAQATIVADTTETRRRLSEENASMIKEMRKSRAEITAQIEQMSKDTAKSDWKAWAVFAAIVLTAIGSGLWTLHLTQKPILVKKPTPEQIVQISSEYLHGKFDIERTDTGYILTRKIKEE